MTIAGIPFDYILFGLMLAGIAVAHGRALPVAVSGLVAIVIYQFASTGFREGPGIQGLISHAVHEAPVLINLFLLLTGFAVIAQMFEKSRVPDAMPAMLPANWTGPLLLLALIFVLSSFLDNIAGAVIGGTIARHVFKSQVHLSFLVAIVAASNAGGSGSVIGDTTTTMMWIQGVAPSAVFHAYAAAVVAFVIFAVPAALAQYRLQPVSFDAHKGEAIDWVRLGLVAAILSAAVTANIAGSLAGPDLTAAIPVLGLTLWAAILVSSVIRPLEWMTARSAAPGALFLLALVMAASLMPIESLPAASWQTSFGLGILSAVFDNIPLTALALRQGGYDWGVLAFTVGFGGSMTWFGSSAGVALTSMYPEARSLWRWLKAGWTIPLAYVAGFIAVMATFGWRP